MFTIIVIEQPQLDATMPLNFDGISSEPIERLRITFSKLTNKHLLALNKLAWNIGRKTRKDKGVPRKGR